tara:strand:- start:3630 stop:4139 length:510 start_codon:yes stop_codon:yes gene_type:complete
VIRSRQDEDPPIYRIGRSRIHKKGLFATREIMEGTRIIEYIGEKVTKTESDRRGLAHLEEAKNEGLGLVYLFELNKRYDLDGNVPENFARHINHSCFPNCESQIKRGRVWIVSVRMIGVGEELSYDYGYDLEHYEEHPCHCGSKKCIGYIVAHRHRKKLRRILTKTRKD